jgi:hypothetical protein
VLHRIGKVRQVHRLLRVAGAAEAALAGAGALARGPGDGVRVEAERLGAAAHDAAVHSHDVFRHRLDGELLVEHVVLGAHACGLRELGTVGAGPLVENRIRRPQQRARVHHGRPAHDAAHGHRDQRAAEGRGEAVAPVVLHRPVEGLPAEVVPLDRPALLDDRDVEARARQLARHGRAARAASHDRDVAVDARVAGELGMADDGELHGGRNGKPLLHRLVRIAHEPAEARIAREDHQAEGAQGHGHAVVPARTGERALQVALALLAREGGEGASPAGGQRRQVERRREELDVSAAGRGEARGEVLQLVGHAHLAGADRELGAGRRDGVRQRGERAVLGGSELLGHGAPWHAAVACGRSVLLLRSTKVS